MEDGNIKQKVITFVIIAALLLAAILAGRLLINKSTGHVAGNDTSQPQTSSSVEQITTSQQKISELPEFDYSQLSDQLSSNPERARERALLYLSNSSTLSLSEQGRASNIVAISYAMQGDFENALPYAERTYEAALQSGSQRQASGALTNIANMHRQMGNLKEAIRAFETSIDHARENQAYNTWAAALLNLADMLTFHDAAFLAMPLYEEAERLLDKIEDPSFLAPGLISKANAHVDLSQASQASASLDHATELLGDMVSMESQTDLLLARGRLGLLLDDLSDVELAADSCLSISRQHGLRLATGNCLWLKARVAAGRSDSANARLLLSNVEEILSLPSEQQDPGSLINDAQYFRLLADIQKVEGDAPGALRSLEQATILDAMLEDSRRQAELAYFAAGFNEQAKDLQIALMDERSRTMELDAERRTIIAWVTAMVALLLLGVSWLLYRAYGNANRDRSALGIALNERNMLMRELSHRVGNNYQMILSMIRLQRRKAEKSGVSDVAQIEDIQNRIHAMSAIQVKLLGDIGTNPVSLRLFLTDLIENLRAASGKLFDLKVDIPDLALRASELGSIGLIANEIVTNSLKHAFSGDASDGKIAVKLSETKENYCLAFSDNGPGFAAQTDEQKFGLGFSFIEALACQIDGTVELSAEAKGVTWKVIFPKSLHIRQQSYTEGLNDGLVGSTVTA